jgi:hypothetical protein
VLPAGQPPLNQEGKPLNQDLRLDLQPVLGLQLDPQPQLGLQPLKQDSKSKAAPLFHKAEFSKDPPQTQQLIALNCAVK